MKQTRKTPNEIKLEIISFTWGMARNTDDICKLLKSNWSTISKYTDELIKDGVLEGVFISGKIVGYKVKQFIKEIVFNAYKERDFNDFVGLTNIPDKYPIQISEELAGVKE